MRRKFLFTTSIVLLCIATLSFASAYEEGQVLTQQELDAINADNIQFSHLKCQVGSTIVKGNTISWGYNCLYIERYDATQYVILRRDLWADISLRAWKVCRQQYSLQVCQNGVVDKIIVPHATKQLQRVRDEVKSLQTGGVIDEVIDFLNDYNPFN